MTPPLPPGPAFAALRAQLANIEREASKELTKMLRQIGNDARDVVRGSTSDPYLTGGLRRSVKTSVRSKGVVSLYSNKPQAPVHEFGGSIAPRGTPIQIEGTNFVRGTVVALGSDIDEQMAEAFDDIARSNGFL